MAKKERVIEVPANWEAVSYKDYYRFIESIKGQEEDDQLAIEMALQYLCHLNTKDYYKLKKDTFASITNDISNLIISQQSQPLVKSFEFMGTEYALEPSMENMAYGMYLDLSTYSTDMWKNMPIICSILYRPVKAKFNGQYTLYPYSGTNDDTIQIFRDYLTMDICHGLTGFFLSLQTSLVQHSLTYFQKKANQELITHQQEISTKSGVSMQALSHLAEEILQKLKR